jgi:benzylsuccinate CoA-transferase BbsF subunit
MMERWDLGYESLKKIKPDIIMLRLSNQGQTGPFSKMGGLGIQLNALGGFVHFTGWLDREPLALMFAYSDYFVPLMGMPLLCAALDYRRRTGKGMMLDVSQSEVCFQFLAPYLLEYQVNGKESERRGNLHPYAAPHNVYRCKGDNRWCAITVSTEDEWEAFRRVIGEPEWTKEPGFATFLSRKRNEEELNRLIEEWTVNHTAEEAMKLMQEAGVPAGVAQTAEDIYNDPQLRQRNIFWKMNHKEIGEFTHMGQPSNLSKTPAEAKMPAPLIGEHTEYVCKEFLGMSESQYDELLVAGAFGL